MTGRPVEGRNLICVENITDIVLEASSNYRSCSVSPGRALYCA